MFIFDGFHASFSYGFKEPYVDSRLSPKSKHILLLVTFPSWTHDSTCNVIYPIPNYQFKAFSWCYWLLLLKVTSENDLILQATWPYPCHGPKKRTLSHMIFYTHAINVTTNMVMNFMCLGTNQLQIRSFLQQIYDNLTRCIYIYIYIYIDREYFH